MSVSVFKQSNYAEDSGAAYPVNIDHCIAAMKRLGAAFAPHESDPPAMTVVVDAGAIFAGGSLIEVAQQTTGTITAPSGDPRIDRVVIDAADGTVSVVTGSEDPTPAAPAIPAGKLPVAQVALTVGMTEITNADLTDERAGLGGGGGGLNPGPSTELTLASGEIAATASYHTVDTEPDTANPDGVAADTLYIIDASALPDGALLLLAAENAARVVTLSEDDTGSNLNLRAGAFALDSLDKRILLQKRGGELDEILRTAPLLTGGTAQATTSGTSKDWTGIPAGVKHISFMAEGLSTNGVGQLIVQVGDATGGLKTSGYAGAAALIGGSPALASSGFPLHAANTSDASVIHVAFDLYLVDPANHKWVGKSTLSFSNGSGAVHVACSSVQLSGPLDRLRLTTVAGANAFDAGSANIHYE
ncbi:MAG: hypothetical protein Kow00114_32890 [Kiloniellaceae bacterium]